MCLALCLLSSSAVLMLGGSEIFLRRGEGNARQSISGVFHVVLFLAGVWSFPQKKKEEREKKKIKYFPLRWKLHLCSIFTQRWDTSYQKDRRQEDQIPCLWELSSSLDTSGSNDFTNINNSTLRVIILRTFILSR